MVLGLRSASGHDFKIDDVRHAGRARLRRTFDASEIRFDGPLATRIAAAFEDLQVHGAIIADPGAHRHSVGTRTNVFVLVQLIEYLVLEESRIPGEGAATTHGRDVPTAFVADQTEGIASRAAFGVQS